MLSPVAESFVVTTLSLLRERERNRLQRSYQRYTVSINVLKNIHEVFRAITNAARVVSPSVARRDTWARPMKLQNGPRITRCDNPMW